VIVDNFEIFSKFAAGIDRLYGFARFVAASEVDPARPGIALHSCRIPAWPLKT
jgi:hypothetical protein